MAYPDNRDPRVPRSPDRLVDPVVPGAIVRDYDDPAAHEDPAIRDNPAHVQPRDYPRASSAPRGLAGATLAVAVVLLAVLAYSFMGGSDTDETAVVQPEVTQPLGTDNAPTASIADEPATPAQPVQPAQ